MDLIRMTFRCHDGSTETRLATSAQNVDDIAQSYLVTIPGAVMLQSQHVIERNIAPSRAFWVYQAQMMQLVAAPAFAKQRNRGPGRHRPRAVE